MKFIVFAIYLLLTLQTKVEPTPFNTFIGVVSLVAAIWGLSA